MAIARALVNRPAILMADEPTGNLDTKTSGEVIQLLRSLNEEAGITIILVTHDQEIGRHAKRTLVLRDGQIIEDTTDFAAVLRAMHLGSLAPPPMHFSPHSPDSPAPAATGTVPEGDQLASPGRSPGTLSEPKHQP